jgi:hypothetical protein
MKHDENWNDWNAQEVARWAVLRGLQAFAIALLFFTLLWPLIK